ncbi:DUF2789 domain-containing protein [Paracidovorax wautersii]|uniref:DUF2789 domain-containing protein n=1 Tax=Paracidovorax wautersii TaxID=1177982 RepID=UPI0031CF15BF
MMTSDPTMTNLFLQLGLDEKAEAIDAFIRSHQLPTDVGLVEAPFWDDSQRQFLAEQWKADAPWALTVDQLSEALHAEAVRARTALEVSQADAG